MKEPHLTKPTRGTSYVAKTEVKGRMKVVSDSYRENREMNLILQISRAVARHELHELAVTAEDAGPGATVNTVAYQGFFEVEEGGLITIGDGLVIGGSSIGRVCGFDETHYPNHINIIVKADKLTTGYGRGLALRDEVEFPLSSPKDGKCPGGSVSTCKDLRIRDHPVLGNFNMDKTVTIEVDGEKITARDGETIASAIWAAGKKIFRYSSRLGGPRGIYCGIGRCTDCVMMVDGTPNVRTCITRVEQGMVVRTQKGLGRWEDYE